MNFFNEVRNHTPMIDHALEKDKKFFEILCRHGVMRRVGTSYNIYPDKPAATYETRRS